MSNKMEQSLTTTNYNSNWTSEPARSNLGKWKYDVFLSFSGADTRIGFTSHLFDHLRRENVKTFLDNDLNRGEDISPGLLQKIDESYISVVIFSKTYAASSWCLEELVRIYDCKKKGQIVLPVFYQIDPSDVQELKGSYGEDVLAKHGDELKEVQSCALREISAMAGFVSGGNKTDAALIEEIVSNIREKLNQEFLNYPYNDGFVGIEPRIEEIKTLLQLESRDVRFIGIWGIGGIGKTTLARKVFHRFRSQFKGGCIVADVREKVEKGTIDDLQQEIYSKAFGITDKSSSPSIITWMMRTKVLIVVDDVSKLDHVEFLVEDHAIYAPGSRIIMTGRNQQLLKCTGAEIYEVEKLNNGEALQLFCLRAFKQNPQKQGYMEVAREFVEYAQGVPLALKVLGSNLYGKNIVQWENQLKKLESCPDKEIHTVLKISYDGLNHVEKGIFLDIACFFKSEDKDDVVSVLGCAASIDALVDMSLIKISDYNKLEMHDLLQQMGKDIVREEGHKYPEKCSRLWNPQDMCRVLTKKYSEASSVETILLDMSKIEKDIELNSMTFAEMENLRLLKFYDSRYRGQEINDTWEEKVKLHLPKGLSCLTDELRYLYWYRYPSKALPSKFLPECLVQLHLICSQIEQLWIEDQYCFENLRFMDLSYSVDLVWIPDLSKVPKLEVLRLRGCTSLVEILSSTRCDSKLLNMDLGHCKNLCRIPRFSDFPNLNFLSLEGCSKISELPDFAGRIRRLILDGTAVQVLPSSIGRQYLLIELSMKHCTSLRGLPSCIRELKCLESIKLLGCSEMASLPNDIGELKRLKNLHLEWCSKLVNLPDGFCNLKSLECLNISNCLNLSGLPENFGDLESLVFLHAAKSGIKMLPPSINGLNKLKSLNCRGCEGLILPPFTGLSNLAWLDLEDCGIIEISSTISSLVSLYGLYLGGNNFEMLPTSIKQLPRLRELDLRNCKRLGYLSELSSNLQKLVVTNCTSLQRMPTPLPQGNRGSWLRTNATNCVNLNRNEFIKLADDVMQMLENLLPQLKRHFIIKNSVNFSDEYVRTYGCFGGFRIGGGEVPERMRYKNNSGSSLICSVRPDPHVFIVLSFCAVVSIKDCYDPDFFDVKCDCKFGSDLHFTSYERGSYPVRDSSTVKVLDQSEYVFFWNKAVHLGISKYSFSQASFEFNLHCYDKHSFDGEVVKCGVHILYDDTDIDIDLEDTEIQTSCPWAVNSWSFIRMKKDEEEND